MRDADLRARDIGSCACDFSALIRRIDIVGVRDESDRRLSPAAIRFIRAAGRRDLQNDLVTARLLEARRQFEQRCPQRLGAEYLHLARRGTRPARASTWQAFQNANTASSRRIRSSRLFSFEPRPVIERSQSRPRMFRRHAARARRRPGGRHDLRHHHHRLGAGRLCDRHPRGAARLQDRDRRARLSRRHLFELGLHSDQGAAALGRNLPLHAARQGLRAVGRQRGVRSGRRGQALARRRRPDEFRRRLPDEEEQGQRDLGRGRRSTRPARSR